MLTALHDGHADVAIAGTRLQGDELTGAVGAAATRFAGAARVAVVTAPVLGTVIAVAGALTAGCCVVPVNPASGPRERDALLADAQPDVVVDGADVDVHARAALPAAPVNDETAAFVVYTSGTTGPPKGAVLPRRAVAACLDALVSRWELSPADRLVHALPLFHVHGLVLGTIGPLRSGVALSVTPRLQPVDDATVYYAVPTAWGRLPDADLSAMSRARLLVSGSAALPKPVFDRMRAATGQPLVERYGLTETLIVTAATRATAAPGAVGTALDGTEVCITGADEEGMGEVHIRGATVFTGYLNRPDATAAARTDDGWMRTGDLGRYDVETGLRLLGRMATDLVKTGGFKVGAGEVEDALLMHPSVAEVAVTGEPDDDLGERIVAWIVASEHVEAQTLVDHVAATLAPHKRPRVVRFVDSLPRNPMGKVQKTLLG